MALGKLSIYGIVIHVVLMVAYRLENYRLELHDTAGNIIHETMTVTDNGEYITMEDGNTAFYEFQKGMAVIKFNGRDDCYLLFLDTETMTELSTRHILSRTEKLVPVKRINSYVNRTVNVRLVELPVEVQRMCADGNVYMTKSDQTESSRLGKRGDDEAASFFTDCSYFCFSSTECHFVCFV